ncbi:MAG: hypothetical protein RLZZ505_1244 [Verrucomicrobiota bacterium]|jgi:hypothetical protein
MGISAFLSQPMAKEKDKIELRPVDEGAEEKLRFVRLHKDAAEEVEELPPVKVGVIPTNARLEASLKDDLKIRSNEPDVGSLIERDVPLSEEPWENQVVAETKVPWGWVAAVACIFTVAILWSLINLNRGEEQGRSLEEESLTAREKERVEEMDAEIMIGALERAVRGFFDARSTEEMLLHVRQADRVRPLLENYYADSVPEAVRVVNIMGMDPLTIERHASFWMVVCELENGVESQLLVEAISEKEAKVDWETFVCYQPMAWDEFASKRPGGYTGDFRVYVEKDFYHSHEFSDSASFESYRMTVLKGDSVLFGYVPRDGELAQRMSELIDGSDGGAVPLILRLHVPQGVQSPNGVVIREIVNPRWVFVETPAKKEP